MSRIISINKYNLSNSNSILLVIKFQYGVRSSISRTFRYIQKLLASNWIAHSIQILGSLSNKMRVILRSRDTIETGRHSMYSVNLRIACGVRCKALCSTESMFSKSCFRLLKWVSSINTIVDCWALWTLFAMDGQLDLIERLNE